MNNRNKKLLVIIDTNIYISAFCFGGNSQKLVEEILTNDKYELLISTELFNEINEKFLSGRVERIFSKTKGEFKSELAKKYLEIVINNSILITPESKINLCRDPKDNMILELAYTVKADYIISGDKDLLVLNGESFEDYKFNIVDVSGFLELVL